MGFLKLLIIVFLFASSLYAKEIKIGMSADLTGSISYLGNNMKIGIETYFNTINKNSEHKFKLISYDDKYNPIKASQNVRKLIDEDKVLALLGNLGTPTANVVIPIIDEKQIVLFGAYSGGNTLRELNTNEYVYNYRASYSQEANYIVSNLLKLGIKKEEIAVFSQNDTYGDSGYYGVVKAFKNSEEYDISNIAHGRYTRNTLNIENGLSKLLDNDIDYKAIIMVSVDEPAIKFIKYAKEDFPDVKFFTLSPNDIERLSSNLSKHANDIYTTQVVPILSSQKAAIIQEFRSNLKKEFPSLEPNLISLEGYIVAKLFVESIKDIDFENINSKLIFDELRKNKQINIGLGFSSSFDNKSHQYSNKIWLTKIKDKKVTEISWDKIFIDKGEK